MAFPALALIPSAFQLAQGLSQRNKAKNLKEDKFIPPSIREAERRTRFRAGVTKLPGQDRAEENIRKASANAVAATRRSARDSSTVLEKVQETDAQEKAAVNDINARVEGFKLANEQELNRVLSEKASIEKGNRDQYNAAKSALKGASGQNIFNAVSNLATAGVMAGAGGGGQSSAPGMDASMVAPSITKKGVDMGISPQADVTVPKTIDPVFTPMGGKTPDQIMLEVLSGRRKPIGYV